jgi:hypothetical protein
MLVFPRSIGTIQQGGLSITDLRAKFLNMNQHFKLWASITSGLQNRFQHQKESNRNRNKIIAGTSSSITSLMSPLPIQNSLIPVSQSAL